MSKDYKDLIVWQRAMDLTVAIYACTRPFPSEEKFGLVTQLRRAAVSIASNIAEGQGRATLGEFKQFLGHSRGSVHEVETQVQIAQRLQFISEEEASSLLAQVAEVGRLLNGLLRSMKEENPN